MNLFAHFLHRFRNMYLLRKVLIIVSTAILIYCAYLLVSEGYTWPENRGTWLGAVSSLFVALGQWLSHLHETKQLKCRDQLD